MLAYLIRSSLVGMLVILGLAVAGVSGENVALGVALGAAVGVVGGLTGDVSIGIAAGIAGGFVGGVVGGTGYGLAGVGSLSGIFASGVAGVAALGGAGGLGLGVAGSVIISIMGRGTTYSRGWQVGYSRVDLDELRRLCPAFLTAYRLAGGVIGSMSFGAVRSEWKWPSALASRSGGRPAIGGVAWRPASRSPSWWACAVVAVEGVTPAQGAGWYGSPCLASGPAWLMRCWSAPPSRCRMCWRS